MLACNWIPPLKRRLLWGGSENEKSSLSDISLRAMLRQREKSFRIVKLQYFIAVFYKLLGVYVYRSKKKDLSLLKKNIQMCVVCESEMRFFSSCFCGSGGLQHIFAVSCCVDMAAQSVAAGHCKPLKEKKNKKKFFFRQKVSDFDWSPTQTYKQRTMFIVGLKFLPSAKTFYAAKAGSILKLI
ncbi:CLUMA_CG000266, isoform A [Clunio marinus]|uniref:CLUMA_CG000266, isoform A n=1 Tax=Clunio marinus TaxID=568069 RepID=A0A1J1HEI6_9DIPT|nr:CLUMA_CG000266, isoform A [Clunio marinus]